MFRFITPIEYLSKYPEQKKYFTLKELQKRKSDNGECECGQPVWKLVGTGLCFSCTTGEADNSDDYELI